ncbi:MAG: class I SAM-dependent methyltransferase [Pseudonocardia sp.]|nr:class I SAM-dependent methyltransferase [Pseudonocardia sp.]
MSDVVDRLGAAPGRLLDLACGPGSLARRAVRRFPGAEVVGVDFDPVMLELARRTTVDARPVGLGTARGRVRRGSAP